MWYKWKWCSPFCLHRVQTKKKREADQGIESVVDPKLEGNYPRELFETLVDLGLKCSSFNRVVRPTMKVCSYFPILVTTKVAIVSFFPHETWLWSSLWTRTFTILIVSCGLTGCSEHSGAFIASSRKTTPNYFSTIFAIMALSATPSISDFTQQHSRWHH